ncbi:hypothetical protein [Flavivirga jejuensis]|uniref:Glycosyltransferase RgtA/B/C/D-like domain-containing protein n=1 Tax=Flavivirga jejuensis TaxID=870487 RepID=A0ABT8WK76_9FLAO|nr:hypothetical protein [Flavivirga jejuensis]MDO5973559.1 hypothetical protein [Flavivirga jejuensis]
MLNKINKIFENKELYLILLIVILAQLILSFQGFDVCDEGFSLTFYQQIYNNPSSVEYNFVYWLSGVFGGLWYQVYPEGGILWFRILTIIFNIATFTISYKILKHHIGKNHALIGLSMVLFVNDFGYLVFYHNHLTQFLAVLSIYFLFKGLKNVNYLFLIISGFLLGINVFSRLPNVTLFIFILAIPYFGYLKGYSYKKSIKPMLNFIVGIVIGFIAIFCLLNYLGQVDIMKNALLSLVHLGEAEDSGHNIKRLFLVDISNYKIILTLFSQLLIIYIILMTILNYVKTNKFIKGVIYTFGFLVLVLLVKKGNVHFLYTLGFIGTIGVLLIKTTTRSTKVLAFLSILMMVFLPLGSGGGIKSSGYMCIWLAVPFFFYFLSQIKNVSFILETTKVTITKGVSKRVIKNMSIILVLAYFASKTYSVSQEAYFDKGNRFDKTHIIKNKYVNGIFTTEERAKIINDLLLNIENYVEPEDYLFAYDNIPMIHFLTETKPYLYNPWVWIYDSASFKRKINKAEEEIEVLPIVVQQKFETIFEFSKPMVDYLDETKNDSNSYSQKRTIIMNNFLKRNDYRVVWSNAYFNIYRTNKR